MLKLYLQSPLSNYFGEYSVSITVPNRVHHVINCSFPLRTYSMLGCTPCEYLESIKEHFPLVPYFVVLQDAQNFSVAPQ